MVDDHGGAGVGLGTGEIRLGQKDARLIVEALGEVSEQLGENLALAALGAQKMRKYRPLRALLVG